MAARNPESMTNAQGEFTPRKPRDEPMQTGGHKPGVKATPADHAPEFSAQILDAGTAPAESTFTPNPEQGAGWSSGQSSAPAQAQSTLPPGATSADVHTGLGHPGQGQTSTELRHEGHHTSKKHTSGPEGAGASGGSGLVGDGLNAEFRRLKDDRATDSQDTADQEGHNVSRTGAEDMLPVSADEVAAEFDRK